ncbi:hypothetical protein BDW22DRAFT_1466506 [Trametopsis cervina]|nr:hypothetical protein BDW22DRAFT_1466506 [Trametopsis cervina]
MALTAMSPSSLPRESAWDEAIVPALRKRLESESYALSKRMSATSMTSIEDSSRDGFSSNASYVSRDRTVSPTYQTQRPSAIPRPSLQMSRPETGSSSNVRSSRSSSFQRNRTLSQPFPFDRPSANGSTQPSHDPAPRSASPIVTVPKSTRIPVSRTRTGSVSSHQQPSLNSTATMMRTESRNGAYKANGQPYQSYSEMTPDLWPVTEHQQPSSTNSRATLRTPRTQVSELVNEQPPFNANSVSSRGGYDSDPRMSTESEERPFEHWYRGDVSRNGGVGELRVAKRQEMLDIANYGHSLRNASSHTALSNASRSRSNSRGRDLKPSHQVHRPRAESLGARESIYIDDDDRVQQGSMVFDERPPTDLDSDGEEYDDLDLDYYEGAAHDREDTYGQEELGAPPPVFMDRSDSPSTLVEASRSANSNFKSRIPTPTPRQISETRTVTPTQSPVLTAEPSTPKGYSSSQTLNVQANQSSTNKRRAKSPASASSSSKKTRTKSPAKPQPKKKETRVSVAQYPTPEGEDMANAIPSWTQPVPPPSGNWDDAVLPVVARKRGLEGQYQHADGSPKPPKPRESIPEPAPGTFGFKYRPSRNSTPVENIAMDEFGQRAAAIQVEKEETRPSDSDTLIAPVQPLPRVPSLRTDSPAPFAHYAPTPVPQIQITRPSNDVQKADLDVEDEKGAGCCKCVIM